MVSFGGGGGQSQILSGIKNIDFIDITALCTASDSGGSTGIMRKEYGVGGYLGDVSKCLWALSDKKKIENTLMHRFEKGFLKGHSMRNILYSALIEIHGEKEALELMHKIFGINRHRVFPVTFEKTSLQVKLKSGQTISGETYIDTISRNHLWEPERNRIIAAQLSPSVNIYSEVEKKIEEADYIVICPGDLFTSVVPSLLPNGVSKAIKKSKAKIILITNIMTKLGETDGYNVINFVQEINRYLSGKTPDYVISNNGKIPKELLEKYKIREHKVSAVLSDNIIPGSMLMASDLWTKDNKGHIRHDSDKVAEILKKIFETNLKN